MSEFREQIAKKIMIAGYVGEQSVAGAPIPESLIKEAESNAESFFKESKYKDFWLEYADQILSLIKEARKLDLEKLTVLPEDEIEEWLEARGLLQKIIKALTKDIFKALIKQVSQHQLSHTRKEINDKTTL